LNPNDIKGVITIVILCILPKGYFDVGLFSMVSKWTVSSFRLGTLRLYHMIYTAIYCLHYQRYVVQKQSSQNGHT